VLGVSISGYFESPKRLRKFNEVHSRVSNDALLIHIKAIAAEVKN
jgi:hypothetical protein